MKWEGKKTEVNTKEVNNEGNDGRKISRTYKESSKIAEVSPYLSLITLDIKRLNIMVKRQRLIE